MKRFLFPAAVLFVFSLAPAAWAQDTINDQGLIGTLADDDEFLCNDVSGPNTDCKATVTKLRDQILNTDAVEPQDIEATDEPSDEECLSYESTGDTHEWQTCGGGASDTTQRFPIHLITPQQSADVGNVFPTVLNLTNFDDMPAWAFDEDVEGELIGFVNTPESLCGTPAAKIELQIAANATSGVTSLGVSTAAVADGESLDASFTAETIQDVTVPGTAYLRKEVEFDLTADPAAGDHLWVRIIHDGDKSEDTLAVDTLLVAAQLQICVSN